MELSFIQGTQEHTLYLNFWEYRTQFYDKSYKQDNIGFKSELIEVYTIRGSLPENIRLEIHGEL